MKLRVKTGLIKLFSEPTHIPEVVAGSYFPVLDGLRGIAIIMVIFFHCRISSNYFYQTIFAGKLGVEIFFVLSGFLITTLILKEKITTTTVSLKNFYIRRAFRILPLAYLYIAVCLALNFIFHTQVSYIIFAASALFLLDFSYFKAFNNPYTGHYWSLSVEEQFYILFPILLKKSWRLYLGAILLVLCLVPLVITAEFFYFPNKFKLLYFLTHFFIKFQGIAMGCLFSLLVFKYDFGNKHVLAMRYIINPILVIVIFLLRFDDFLTIASMFKAILISSLIGWFIVINLYPGTNIIQKALNSLVLQKLGMLSYSIYIWQQIFAIEDRQLPAWMWTPPYNFILILGVSSISYFFYERYFLKLKAKYSTAKIKPV